MWWWLACAAPVIDEVPVPDTEVVPDAPDTDVVDTDVVDTAVDCDLDDDGHRGRACAGPDCDDADATVYPGAVEVPYDGVDQDCSGADLVDVDGDGAVQGVDCDDADASFGPHAADVPYDGIDQDCDGRDLIDVDGDGFGAELAGGSDCDDADPDANPDAMEHIDRQDDDCDGAVDRLRIDAGWVARTSGSVADTRIGAIDNLAVGDVTGDGLDDLIVGAPVYSTWTGRAYVLDGADVASWTGDVETDAAIVLPAESGADQLGYLPQRLGDVDGDGVVDLVLGARNGGVGIGRAYLLLGGGGWSSLTGAEAVVDADVDGGTLGWGSDASADVDGDGYADWAIGDGGAAGGAGRVGLFLTPPSGAADLADADVTWSGAAGAAFGQTVVEGDLDGDGYAEVLVGAPETDDDAGAVYVLAGGAVASGDGATLAAWSVTGAGTGKLGQNSRAIATPADLDDSGSPEWVVADYQGASTVYVFADPSPGAYDAEDATLQVGASGTTLGSAAHTGDLDDDGIPDLVLGGLGDSTRYPAGGSVWVVWGGPDLFDVTSIDRAAAGAVVESDGAERNLGTAAVVGPDWTGDGTPDLAVISSWDSAKAVRGGSLFVLP